MTPTAESAVAIVGLGAIMPDAPDAAAFWRNVSGGRYSITEVDPARWDPALYYDADPRAPEKTYSTIGGWVRDWEWDPLAWKLPLMPKVTDAMDDAHKWGVACTRMALADAGWPEKPLDLDRTATIIGNALSGEKHYLTALRITFPELARELERAPSFAALPADVRATIERELRGKFEQWLPDVTEDTMPGELSNCIAGRIANLFNLHGPNFTTDAACASALAAVDAAVQGLGARDFDVAIAGGVDRNMGASTFVKFCAIGALSATGTRPYADGADGFVMGEGGALFVLKRLADAERDGDRVYAVIRGVGGSSDGKGKGITAPNPVGQKFAIERAWRRAGLAPEAGMMIEGHGTSTRAGDLAEVESLGQAFGGLALPPGSIALGSVKSNIGHLKAAAGAAGLLKTTLALHHRQLPPSLNFAKPNPNIDWGSLPFAVNTELREWEPGNGSPRAAGVSAFGFGGTNFHVVLEEHVPGRFNGNGHGQIAVPKDVPAKPSRGLLLLGADDEAGLAERLRAPVPAPPDLSRLRAPERVCIDHADEDDLRAKAAQALKALESGNPAAWKALQGRGIFRGSGAPGKVAFLYTGQGSQYANMLADLRRTEPVVARTFDEADEILRPLLDGRRLSDVIFTGPEGVAEAEAQLMRTEITQPAVITADVAMTRLLAAHGIEPDFVMGHSVGEYGALVAAGVMTFEAALEAVSARGREMAGLQPEDPGAMAAVSAPLEEAERIVQEVDGYVVLANVNSNHQVVMGGATEAVERAMALVEERGHRAFRLPVSHAFHTEIVAAASEPLKEMLRRLRLSPPRIPVVANLTGDFYPAGDGVEEQFVEILGRQVASQVQFVKGLHTLYDAGARVFVETGPKRALWGFAADVLGDDAMSLFTNHPKVGDVPSFNQALAGLYAAGIGAPEEAPVAATPAPPAAAAAPAPAADDPYRELGRMLAEVITRGQALLGAGPPPRDSEPVVVTGAAVGTPGTEKVFDEANLSRLLHGEQLIDSIPNKVRHEMVERHITRLVKGEDGSGSFETIGDPSEVIKLAARAGALDLAAEFGVDTERVAALGRHTQLAIAAGIDALRDAGIPLAQHYKTTTTGSKLPDRWLLPDELRDDTGVIFCSAFPGLEEMTGEVDRFWADRSRREQLRTLQEVRARMDGGPAGDDVDRRIRELESKLDREPYTFDRRFLFRILSMGHSQFAELIGARGPNTQLNAACASTTQAVAVAEDWIRAGRCRRVVVVAADDATSDALFPWIGSGFLASGAAATDALVEDAALPFDVRRHGMIIGMGAAGLVVESAAAARERGMTPICEVLGSVSANSAFHGTRLDVEHIGAVMEAVVRQAEARGISRDAIAPETVFVSHETYTPARGGSAAAEIDALRRVFGERAGEIVIANTKGMTGHPMGVGIEDVVAVKALETGLVPAVPNFREVDPELGVLNLSKGGLYPVRYALRLAAGFGSQISMMLLRWTPVRDGRRRAPEELGFGYRIADEATWNGWLRRITGQPDPQLEVVQHRLRVADTGPVDKPAAPVVVPVPVTGPAPAPAAAAPMPVAAVAAPAPVAAPAFAAAPEPVAAPASQPVATPAPQPEPVPVAPAPAGVADEVISLVAGQTGYPADMLDPELDLEADLGIDTVKQAEVFAAIRERYGIERDDSLKLRDYPTLRHVVQFVEERAPQAAAAPAPGAAPEPAPAPEPEAAPEPPPAAGDILGTILDVVAGQTGYPADMLDPELDLEADLGIDTVKQAEVFAAIRERYGIERDDTLQLRDYPTLDHVVRFVEERRPQSTPEPEPVAAPEPAEAPGEGVTAFPRRVPVPVVRPALEQCVPTGVRLGEGSRVIVAPDGGGVAAALTKRLAKLGVEIVAPDERERVDGVYWLPGLDAEAPLGALDPAAWREGLDVRVKRLAELMRELPETAFLISATRLGGRHGYDAAGATSVMGGAVTGFTKALARERPETLIKAIDFEPSRRTAEPADVLVAETLSDPGAVEIGHADGLRWTVALVEAPAAEEPGRALTPDASFVVTGAAGSIVSAITMDLAAAAQGGTFHLLDLVAAPDPGDPDIARFGADRDGLKRELADRLREQGTKPTPKLVERELARIERARAALDAIEAIEAAGGAAVWHQVDLTDAGAVREALAGIESVDVLLHCAGLEISHFLPDKPQSEYDLVFDVKALGWLHVLHALKDAQPGTALAFSSIAGRFGNGGQTDYSAANDLLCKAISHLRRTGETRGIAIDWTAWGGIGMATRGSIPKMMEAAGIDMLPPETGVPAVRRELTAAGDGGEVVIAGGLGVLLEERHPTGGLDTGAAGLAAGPMTGRVTAMTVNGGLEIRTELDPARQRFLDDHRIEGTPVLPGVMGIEAFAETARALLPEHSVAALEDVDLQAPFKFYRDEPRTLELRALIRDGGEDLIADCRLVGRRALASGETMETVHFTGRARLSRQAPEAPTAEPPGAPAGADVAHEDVYRIYFHGPAYQVLDRAYRHDGAVVGELAGDLPADHDPPELPTLMVPRLIELCFQTAGVWELGTAGRLALPTHVDRVMRFPGADDPGRLAAIVRPRDDGETLDAEVVDEHGRVRVRIEGYRTIALPMPLDESALAAMRAAVARA